MNFKKFRGKEKSSGRQSTWLAAAFSPNSVGEEGISRKWIYSVIIIVGVIFFAREIIENCQQNVASS